MNYLEKCEIVEKQRELITTEVIGIITKRVHVSIVRIEIVDLQKRNGKIEKTVEETNRNISTMNENVNSQIT